METMVYVLIGVVTSFMGYPIYDFGTGIFSIKNTIIVTICSLIAHFIIKSCK